MIYCKNCKQNIEPKLNKLYLITSGIFMLLFIYVIYVIRKGLCIELKYSGEYCFPLMTGLALYGNKIFIPLVVGIILLMCGIAAIVFGIIDKRCPLCNSKNSDMKSKE